MMTEQEHNNVQWRKVKLGDCCSINPKTDISKVQNDDIVSFVKMEDVSNDGFITSFSERPYKSLQKKGFTIFQNDDVIFAKITPCMENGKGALVRNMKSKICLGSTEFHVLRACANVSIDFIYQLTISKRFRQRAEMQMTGSAGQQRVPTAFLEDCLISIPFKNNKPDLSVQRRIAAILASADKVIAATQKTIAKYKQMKQGMMEDLLKPKEGWKKVRLGEVGEIITGPFGSSLHEKDYTKTGTPIVNPQNIVNGRIIPMDKCLVSDETVERLCKFKMNAGDIVIARRGEMGRCAVVEENQEGWLCGTGSFVIKVDSEKIDSNFIQLQLSSDNTKIILENNSIGATMSNLNQGILCELEFLVPDLPEQRRIAKMLSGIDRKIAAEEKVLEKYEKVKKGLMEKLLNE